LFYSAGLSRLLPAVVLESSGSPLNPATFEDLQDTPNRSTQTKMAYRPAGFLSLSSMIQILLAFQQMVDSILQDRPFSEALAEAYATDLPAVWSQFV
jgi:hypothetical protein